MLSLGVAALGSFGLAVGGSELAIILGGGALAGGTLAAWPIILGYTAELYPTRVRATAAGWAGVVSRSGGVAAPLLMGVLLASVMDQLPDAPLISDVSTAPSSSPQSLRMSS